MLSSTISTSEQAISDRDARSCDNASSEPESKQGHHHLYDSYVSDLNAAASLSRMKECNNESQPYKMKDKRTPPHGPDTPLEKEVFREEERPLTQTPELITDSQKQEQQVAIEPNQSLTESSLPSSPSRLPTALPGCSGEVPEEKTVDANKTSTPSKTQTTKPRDTDHPNIIEENCFDRTKDVVLGQGSHDEGVKTWCDLMKEARSETTMNESNPESLARSINEKIKSNRGRFIDSKQPRNKKKYYFEMTDSHALKLTMGALSRVYRPLKKEADVVLGRGGTGNNNPGNKIWRMDIEANREAYNAMPSGGGLRHKKTELSRKIVEQVYERGGRFITDENSAKGEFYIVPKKDSVEKTSQCLREKRKKTQDVSRDAKRLRTG